MAEPLDKKTLPENLLACCEALSDKKAADLVIIDVKGVSSITDYYVVANGESSPQLKAMAHAARASIKAMNEAAGIIDGDATSGWVVMDAYEFVVHLFTPETRDIYAIESLWKDRPSVKID